MADEKTLSLKLLLGGTKGKPVRFSHLHVFKPRLQPQSGKMEYSVAILIPKTNTEDIAAVRKAIDELKHDTWGSKKKPLPPKFWYPLRDGDKDVNQKGEQLGAETRGHYVLNAKCGDVSKSGDKIPAPGAVGTTKDADGKLVKLGPSDIKSGDWGRASVNMSAYTIGDSGVGAYIVNLQLTKKGEPLAGGRSAEDDFGSFEDEEEDDPLNS